MTMKYLSYFAALSLLVSVVAGACVDPNSGLAVLFNTTFANPTSIITFDDMGFPQSQGNQINAFPLSISNNVNQSISLQGTNCRLYYGPGDIWTSTSYWSGSTTEMPGYYMSGGYPGSAATCIVSFDPPINAFLARVNGRESEYTAYDVNGSVIECFTVDSFVAGKNTYEYVGLSSIVPIAAFSISANYPLARILADSIQYVGNCPEKTFFDGTSCVGKFYLHNL